MEWTPFVEPITNLLLIGLLVWYRINRKFKKEPVKGWKALIDRNMVEIIIGAMVVPGVVGVFAKMLNGG